MKKLVLLACVFALLIVATGGASAHNSGPDQFTITGGTDAFNQQTLFNGLIIYQSVASGDVNGYFDGADFRFVEWGIGSFNPETMEANGINYGDMVITNGPGNRAFVRFAGQADLFSVWGSYRILQGTGQYAGLRGQGTYTGSTDLGYGFSVQFSGNFYTQP